MHFYVKPNIYVISSTKQTLYYGKWKKKTLITLLAKQACNKNISVQTCLVTQIGTSINS